MKKTAAQKQMDILMAERKMLFEEKAKIKNWCITIWVGIILAISTGKLLINDYAILAIMIFPSILFWFLETSYGAVLYLRYKQMIKLEKIFEHKNDQESPSLFVFTNYDQYTPKDKVMAFIKCFLTMETITVFYLFIISSSIVIYLWVL